MPTLNYNVRLAAQMNNNSCWNASAQMIWWYWQGKTGRAGPMNTLQNKFASAQPIQPPHHFIVLAKTVGLIPVAFAHPFTEQSLHDLLKDNGPLCCAGFWYGPGHVIVLTGTDGAIVHLNDSDGGIRKK